jgi:N-acyl-D-aspartate/D-glutamate deacylase
MYVMGEEATERTATDDEIVRMEILVREAIDAGAVGFATSKAPTHVGYDGKPVPSRAADLNEIRQLAAAMAGARQGVMQATLGPELLFNEFASIAADTGRPISWTALLAGLLGPGSHRGFLQKSIELLEQGLPIVPQVSCRPLVFEFQFKEPFLFESMRLFQPVSAADFEGKKRIYADPAFRESFRKAGTSGVFAARWERTVITSSPSDPSLEERTVAEVAASRGVDPVDLALDLALASNLEARFRMPLLNDNEDEVAELLTDPHTVLGLSDAGAHASQLCDACFSTHLLGHWVREKQVLPLEEAVRMLTSRPAEVFGIADRGRIAPGRPADVVVFDPRTVAAGSLRRVHDLPAGADRLISDASGIDAVTVNGVTIRRDGRDVVDPDGELPGRLLRNGKAV